MHVLSYPCAVKAHGVRHDSQVFLFLQEPAAVSQPRVAHYFCSGEPSREERRLIPLVRGGVRKSATVHYTHINGCLLLPTLCACRVVGDGGASVLTRDCTICVDGDNPREHTVFSG